MKLEPQKKAIVEHRDGPLLVIAGPGAGKTMAIVERVVHLLGPCHVAPENLLVSTFTEKAAKELVTRISRRVAEENINVSLSDMYIGTMHSIFLRILKDHAEFTRLRKNYKTLDDFDQRYLVYRHMYPGKNGTKGFRDVDGIDLVAPALSNWEKVDKICTYVNKVRDEAIDAGKLLAASEPEVKALGEVFALYNEIMLRTM